MTDPHLRESATLIRAAHDPAWYVPLRARKAHWFDGSYASACRYYLDSERGRLIEREDLCKACAAIALEGKKS
ncbi:MAG: hypothetical protein JWM47_4512 [Acidimicrobiales bacterium]|nr:hypothetical protein [Acidimicrobiales bacterium]